MRVDRLNGKFVLAKCPYHDDEHASWSGNKETGAWKCFACGKKGTLPQLAKKLGVPVPHAGKIVRVEVERLPPGFDHQVNARYGAMTLASARLLQRSRAPDVISPAWKPEGPRNSL